MALFILFPRRRSRVLNFLTLKGKQHFRLFTLSARERRTAGARQTARALPTPRRYSSSRRMWANLATAEEVALFPRRRQASEALTTEDLTENFTGVNYHRGTFRNARRGPSHDTFHSRPNPPRTSTVTPPSPYHTEPHPSTPSVAFHATPANLLLVQLTEATGFRQQKKKFSLLRPTDQFDNCLTHTSLISNKNNSLTVCLLYT